MNIINLPIDAIIPYERNPRRNDGAVEAVAASIREFGFKVPFVVAAHVAGHTRHGAAHLIMIIQQQVVACEKSRNGAVKNNKGGNHERGDQPNNS